MKNNLKAGIIAFFLLFAIKILINQLPKPEKRVFRLYDEVYDKVYVVTCTTDELAKIAAYKLASDDSYIINLSEEFDLSTTTDTLNCIVEEDTLFVGFNNY